MCRGFTRQPQNSKRAHLSVPAHKNSTRRPPERERARKWAGEGKKRTKFWAVRGGSGGERGVGGGGFGVGGGRTEGGPGEGRSPLSPPLLSQKVGTNCNNNNCKHNYNHKFSFFFGAIVIISVIVIGIHHNCTCDYDKN